MLSIRLHKKKKQDEHGKIDDASHDVVSFARIDTSPILPAPPAHRTSFPGDSTVSLATSQALFTPVAPKRDSRASLNNLLNN